MPVYCGERISNITLHLAEVWRDLQVVG